jgi:hypothetical protein
MNFSAAFFSSWTRVSMPGSLRVCTLTLILMGLLGSVTQAQAIQWKWLDAQGKVQYSDRPPPNDVPDKNILKRPPGRSGTSSATKVATAPSAPSSAPLKEIASTDPELEKKRREKEAAEQAKQKAEEEKRAQARAENCQKARKYDRALEQGYRVSRTNDKGEREFLDEQALAAEKANARRVISSDCR